MVLTRQARPKNIYKKYLQKIFTESIYMIRFFFTILIALLVTTSAVISSANALEVKNSCCCSEITATVAQTIQNYCACCTPIPNHRLPNKATQIRTGTTNTDLQTFKLLTLPEPKQATPPTLIDRRGPVHLASNKIYLRKRALLI